MVSKIKEADIGLFPRFQCNFGSVKLYWRSELGTAGSEGLEFNTERHQQLRIS